VVGRAVGVMRAWNWSHKQYKHSLLLPRPAESPPPPHPPLPSPVVSMMMWSSPSRRSHSRLRAATRSSRTLARHRGVVVVVQTMRHSEGGVVQRKVASTEGAPGPV
jgi:hypothetical protein